VRTLVSGAAPSRSATSKTSKELQMNLKARIGATAIGAALAFTGAAVAAPSAFADDGQTNGCTWGWSEFCVTATTGTKDPNTHTQWVGWVSASALNTAGVVEQEAWGDGFYFDSAVDPNIWNPTNMWGAQRWVASDTNVCTRSTMTDGSSTTACIHIYV
jgi:hypothetical protein